MTTDADEQPTDEPTDVPTGEQAPPTEPQAPGNEEAPVAAEQATTTADEPAPAEDAAQAAEAPTADTAQPADEPAPGADTAQPADEPAPGAEATPSEAPTADAQKSADADAAAKPSEEKPAATDKPAAKKARRRKPRERKRKVPDLPRTRAPLPLDELRDASRSTMNLFGPRRALRDALTILAPRERQELNVLVAADEDHRPRARNIANGSLGAGRIDKAMAATIVSMAPQEDLWSLLLDKEQAAQKLGRIREAKQRDKQRADRNAERANRADRVSREDMAKASDGRVGATIRFVTDEKSERRAKDKKQKAEPKRDSVLDRLGY